MSSSSFAKIVGTEDFDGGKSGWDWNNSGTAQEWYVQSGTFTTENGRGKIVAQNGGTAEVFLNYNSSSQLTSGTFAYTFDMQFPDEDHNEWGGLSLYGGNTESLFNGKLMGMSDYRNKSLTLRGGGNDDYTKESYLNTNKTYAVVANSSGISLWAYDLGTTPQYEDLYTTPTLQISSTLSGNNRFRLGTSGTMYYDNIKMAYSDSSTTSKGDTTSTTSLTEIFGAVPTITCIKESFSGYTTGNLNGQYQKNLGQAPLTKWVASAYKENSATINTSENLTYKGSPKN